MTARSMLFAIQRYQDSYLRLKCPRNYTLLNTLSIIKTVLPGCRQAMTPIPQTVSVMQCSRTALAGGTTCTLRTRSALRHCGEYAAR